MAAPKGNQNAVGKGRPPKPGYTDTDLIKLGEELSKWMDEVDANKTNVVHLSEWYSHKKKIPYSQWKSIIIRDCFTPYYERAIKWMGVKILKNKTLPTAYGSRFLSIYFIDVRERERAEKEFEAELKRKSNEEAVEAMKNVTQAFVDAGINHKRDAGDPGQAPSNECPIQDNNKAG